MIVQQKQNARNESTVNWDSVAKSIADGEAVLVLGPDSVPLYPAGSQGTQYAGTEMTFSQVSREYIKNNPDISINYYYEKDNLFLFRDEMSKKAARKSVRDAARDNQWLPDEELLRQIVSVPFPVILSLSPDRAVYEAFIRYSRITPQFDFCSPYNNNKPQDKIISEPTASNPLIYNLCGNIFEKLDSPVLDFFDLFQLLIKLLSNSDEIPVWLGRKLKEADTYILMGFQLERWYFQLFLHYINWLDNNAYTNSNQNLSILSKISDDSAEFILNQFNLKHIAPNRSDFDALCDACKKAGVLRPVLTPASPTETQVRMLVEQSKLDEALDLIEAHIGSVEKQIDLPHIRARYNNWKVNYQEKREDQRDLQVEINKIRYTVLTYAAQLSAPEPSIV